jgi:hypothetical protein
MSAETERRQVYHGTRNVEGQKWRKRPSRLRCSFIGDFKGADRTPQIRIGITI